MLTSAPSYTVYLWSADELRIEEELACATQLPIGLAALDAAAARYPDRLITLRGPGALELRTTGQQADVSECLQVQ